MAGTIKPEPKLGRVYRAVFLLAYLFSGLAGLIYEVSWTRVLTLYIGHTTAAASAVVAAFMGGLAAGAALGGRFAARFTTRQGLLAYVVLESVVVVVALVLPYELAAMTPVLRWAYQNGEPGAFFPIVRLASCLIAMFIPALALGATFPMAVRCFANRSDSAARAGGALYAVNTAGAAAGALVAGFVLIPTIGVSGTTWVGIAASALAIGGVLIVMRFSNDSRARTVEEKKVRAKTHGGNAAAEVRLKADTTYRSVWLASVVLGLSGLASLMFEIVWTRVLALTVGPTIYAFAATLAALICGLAIGSAIGAWGAGRTKRPAAWLGLSLAVAAIATSWTTMLAGSAVPRYVADRLWRSPELAADIHTRGAMLMAALILPAAAALGGAFPLALATIGDDQASAARRFGLVYAVNTVGAVLGSLIAGFVAIPILGLQNTLYIVSVLLMAAGLVVLFYGQLSQTARIINLAALAVAGGIAVWSPPWDRELLASGMYLYAPYVARDLDLEALLKAGTVLYYREGGAATVTVKRLTGTTSLAIDGKTDASNRSDMLTQKLIAHLPLLLHDHPRAIGIIGLGSGVTLAAALQHPIERVDVVEISPEVVEASEQFVVENRRALNDQRAHLIVGDGRSHLLLGTRQYDVIISEPSNPWIAGVAALFTREFFSAVRSRLAPGGIICQWAHTYHIGDRDLRAIAATFSSVFPNGTMWLVGEGDVLFIASDGSLDMRLAGIERGWRDARIAADLTASSAFEPFALWSLFAGGPEELKRYAAGAPVLTDDLMTLEFSGPRELQKGAAGDNTATLAGLLDPKSGPAIVQRAKQEATAAQWRRRGAMMFKSDAHATAFDDYGRALTLDPKDSEALDGLVQTAILAGRVPHGLARVNALVEADPRSVTALVAKSKLLAAGGSFAQALETAREAAQIAPVQPRALEQIASLYADAGNSPELDVAVAELTNVAPDRAPTLYYAAAAKFLHGQFADALRLAQRASTADANYAAVYDLLGAIHLKLQQPNEAHAAFEMSLRLNAHDSSAYSNLGLLSQAMGRGKEAAGYFAEALWLDPSSTIARQGLARARVSVVGR